MLFGCSNRWRWSSAEMWFRKQEITCTDKKWGLIPGQKNCLDTLVVQSLSGDECLPLIKQTLYKSQRLQQQQLLSSKTWCRNLDINITSLITWFPHTKDHLTVYCYCWFIVYFLVSERSWQPAFKCAYFLIYAKMVSISDISVDRLRMRNFHKRN